VAKSAGAASGLKTSSRIFELAAMPIGVAIVQAMAFLMCRERITRSRNAGGTTVCG